MIRPIAHSRKPKRVQPQDKRVNDEPEQLPVVMKRRCPACKRVFECSDVVKDVICADCLAMAMM